MIRAALVADAAGIAAVHVASWRAAYQGLIDPEHLAGLDVEEGARAWATRLKAGELSTWVAEERGEIVGFCSLRPSPDPDDDVTTAEIAMLYVSPAASGRGLGPALLDEALAAARSAFKSASLWVLERNERARRFYTVNGWRDDGGRKDCFGGVSAPVLRMRLPLVGGVRAARAADGRRLAEINIAAWNLAYRDLVPDAAPDALDEDELAAAWGAEAAASDDGPDVRLWVVERDALVVGYARTGPTREIDLDPRTVGEVYGLYLDPAALGIGAGAALFGWATEDLARRFRRGSLRVVEANARARRFYEKHGWTLDRVAPAKPFHGAPQVRYVRDLLS